MSGNSDHTVSCPACGHVHTPRGRAMTLAMTCASCNIYFRTGSWNRDTTTFNHEETPALIIGARGEIEGYVYEVMGFVVKQEAKYHYAWREYLVFNPYRGYAFLSEYDGHWNFIWPIEENLSKHQNEGSILFENKSYDLYQRYQAQVIFAKGEFFFDVVDITATTVNAEYIAPPNMVALEKSEDSLLWCKGEYFTRNEIAKIFSTEKAYLPKKKGIGYTQPLNSNFTDSSLVTLTALVILLSLSLHLFLNGQHADKVVFHRRFSQRDLDNQRMVVSPSFEFDDGTKSLAVIIEAPLENDWFFSEFTLVDETDGTQYNFAKEIGYYYGREGGESWSEGSRVGEAYLSQIPSGKYHLAIFPEFSLKNKGFTVTVSRDVPTSSNFYVTALVLAIYPAFYFIRRRYREQKRWSESDYSPYHSE